MPDNNTRDIEKFIENCDELIKCKFLVADSKIQRLLGSIAESPAVYQLISDCMEHFNRDRECSKAFVRDSKGNFICNMPQEEFKVVALVFCILADINAGKIEFMDFVKSFFTNDEKPCYQNFLETMIIPFRNLVAEAYGLPKYEDGVQVKDEGPIAEPEKEVSQFVNEEIENRIIRFPSIRNNENAKAALGEKLNKLCEITQKVTGQILEELDLLNKRDYRIDELKSICYAIIIAAADQDYDVLRGLSIGLKYACKNAKSIKFLVRELCENIDDFQDALVNL